MPDIVERLRESGIQAGYRNDYTWQKQILFDDAADEIERLRALNEKTAKSLAIATAALDTLILAVNKITSDAVWQMEEIADA